MKRKVLPTITSVMFILNIGLFVVVIMMTTDVCINKDGNRSKKITRLNARRNLEENHNYIASLIVKKGDHAPIDIFKCSTVILSKHWTLTIAHCLLCFREFGDKSIRIVTSTSSQWNTGREHEIEIHLAHKKYLHKHSSYNIGLIKVVQPFFGKFEEFAILPAVDYLYVENSTAMSYSWNIATSTQPVLMPFLQVAEVFLFSQQYCKSLNKNHWKYVTSSMICAGIYEEKDQVCTFDSGGPLVQDGIVIALMVWGARCNELPKRAVYIRLAYFKRCIEEVLDGDKIPQEFLKLS
ncbi:hypothetical protein ILUMI_11913 [Ignelater luminosus]|uniref:Peptidase S1 domain-containing protein n=1 Tax=Ignelater luminosus TaxID=2038154 RepID=A0A8K0CVC8_IGNLU|nr:hypothetical protein ILUMI_11913 [Ignelater luminosus]